MYSYLHLFEIISDTLDFHVVKIFTSSDIRLHWYVYEHYSNLNVLIII